MLTPKKTIPSLAVSMLALTSCGGDGGNSGTGGTGGNGGNSLSGALQAFCMNFVECRSELFDTVQDCLDYYNNDIFPYYNIENADCEAAFLSYFNCGAALPCEEIMPMSNRCADEFDAFVQICVLGML